MDHIPRRNGAKTSEVAVYIAGCETVRTVISQKRQIRAEIPDNGEKYTVDDLCLGC